MKDEAAAKIQKGKDTNLNAAVEYLDISETPSEAEEEFEEARKQEALSAAKVSQRESAIFDYDDDDE